MYNRNGSRVNPTTITYRWSQNGEYRHLASQSGYGRNSVVMKADPSRASFRLEVEASSLLDGNTKGKGNNRIQILKPQIVFYKEDPLGGINYERAILGTLNHKAGTDLHLVAEPYFITPTHRLHQDLDYRWTLDGRVVPREELPNKAEVLLVSSTGQRGTSRLSVSVSNTVEKFQATKADLVINVQE
jgi:hypothetical protein